MREILLDPYISILNPEEFIDLRKQCLYNLALINKDLKNFFESLYYYHQYYILNPKNKTVVIELAAMSQKVGFLKEALFFWHSVENTEDGFSGRSRDYWVKIGECCFFMGNLKGCQYWFSRVAGIINQHGQ